MSNRPSRLFCWSGGGFPGLDIHMGIWRALSNAGIQADANAGTSAGAIMAALDSSGRTSYTMLSILLGLDDSDIRKERFSGCWFLALGWISYFLDPAPIRNLLTRLLPGDFADLKKPLSVFVTDEITGRPVEVRDNRSAVGSLYDAIMASMAIMGVFPAVKQYSDGGTTANLPLPADWQKYDEIYLLIAKRPLTDYAKIDNGSILTRLLFNVDILAEDQIDDMIYFAKSLHPRIIVIRPTVQAPSGALHFDHSLIAKAFQVAQDQLKAQGVSS